MAAKDAIHDKVKQALINDGWQILAEHYTIKYGDDQVFVDLAAQQSITAEKAGRKIMVEVKSFSGRSAIQDLKVAVGQYMIYLPLLADIEPEYKLYLAISEFTYLNDFQRDIIKLVVERNAIPLIVVDLEKEAIVQWIR